jgi:hypothetical protein
MHCNLKKLLKAELSQKMKDNIKCTATREWLTEINGEPKIFVQESFVTD